MAKNPKVVAIGEIGLDYFSYKSNGIVDKKIQREVFEAQIEIAYKLKLPFQIHGRHAGDDIIEVLSANKKLLKIPACFIALQEILIILKFLVRWVFMLGLMEILPMKA